MGWLALYLIVAWFLAEEVVRTYCEDEGRRVTLYFLLLGYVLAVLMAPVVLIIAIYQLIQERKRF